MRPSRIIVGEVRQAECLDLLIALNTGLPGHVHHARQQRPRGAHQDVHAAAAGRGERRQRGSSCRPSPARVDLVVHVGARRATASDGSARSSPCPDGSRATSSRSPTSSSSGDGELVRADGFPPHARPVRASRVRPRRPAGAGRLRWQAIGGRRAAARASGCSASGGRSGPRGAGAVPSSPGRPAGPAVATSCAQAGFAGVDAAKPARRVCQLGVVGARPRRRRPRGVCRSALVLRR